MSEHQAGRQPSELSRATYRIGCVSYLNAKPLIDGLEDQPDMHLRLDVPARLFEDLVDGAVDIALCPVADLHRPEAGLCVVPVGGIGSDGPTFTVRLYSRVPLEQITAIHADSESHTSVMLLRVLMRHRLGHCPSLLDYHAREHVAEGKLVEQPQAMLLIGDKVVTDSPLAVHYPYQLDLGQAWHEWTGLPFVFAAWSARQDADLGALPKRLADTLALNRNRIDAVAERYAPVHGWPVDLAKTYLGRIMCYDVGQRQLDALERFSSEAAKMDLLPHQRPLRLYPM
ncbi:MAG: menaquinone biosynthesis protein [Phycisphaeraceae bacterium]|nr:menaquinone biosynthesis protein [Phycisphaeraceae bacterium]